DLEHARDVALKVLKEVSPEDFYWIKREFRILHGIGHPNLVRFYDLTTNETSAFFTMELLDGRDLLAFVRERRAPSGEADIASLMTVFGELARGLDALHRAGKLHRDIKPSNVFVTRAGRVVLLDFGLAVPRVPRNLRDASRSFVGTLQY